MQVAKHRPTRMLVAVKVIKKHRLHGTEGDWERMRSEVEISSRLQHPNVVRLYEVIEDEFTLKMVMEYAPNGTLSLLVAYSPHGRLGRDVGVPICLQLLDALAYCHSHFVIHRDIKPENILVFPGNVVKLTDFGFSKVRTSTV
jgi:serine/threonine protein kinase